MKFREWWEQSKGLYESLGVTKDTAYSIWCAAIDQATIGVLKHINKS